MHFDVDLEHACVVLNFTRHIYILQCALPHCQKIFSAFSFHHFARLAALVPITAGTPSTGYSWTLCENTTSAVDLVNHKETDVPPDNWTFDFIVTSKITGVYQIIAGYSNPWLHGEPEQTSTVNVHLVY